VSLGAASVFGFTRNSRRPRVSSSGDEKYFLICFVAWAGRRLPTGTPPTVTPSGSVFGGGGGFGTVVVVRVVVV